MATSQAAPPFSTTAAAIAETIVGCHLLKIDGFSGTKDLGVGKSIKSSTFSVGGHGWYMECYPCGVNEESAGWVSLYLCLSDHNEQVEADCCFTAMDKNVEARVGYEASNSDKQTYNAETSWRWGSDLIKRAKLESLLKDDRFKIRCDVSMVREFPAVPPLDLHRPLSDLLASGMPADQTFQVGGELFTVHRGLPGPSAHVVAVSPTSAGASNAARISADIDNVDGSHVLTIDGYSKSKEVSRPGDKVKSEYFVVGGRPSWHMELYLGGECENEDGIIVHCLPIILHHDVDEDLVVKVRLELTLLTLTREIISSAQICYAFTEYDDRCPCFFPFNMETERLLGDSFHVKCDVTLVKEIASMRPPDLHWHFGNLLASQVGTDVEFEVGGDLFSAHKCVLATRSTAFMAEFFGPGKDSTTVAHVRIEDMEPRIFKALLHFIYTDTLPVVRQEEDKIVMAKGLLVAADRYAMERLKLICGDMLCSYVNDAPTASDALELADKHGCRTLKEKCIKLLKGHFAKVAP